MDEVADHDDRVARFPSTRGQATHFKSWARYLSSLAPPTQSPLWDLLQERGRRPAEPSGRRPKEQSRAPMSRLAKRIPWVTFVLGSGCLTTADVSPDDVPDATHARRTMRDQLGRDLQDVVQKYPNLALDELAARFIELLTVERTGIKDANEAFATVVVRADVQPREHSARLALAAALATQLYALALGSRPLLQSADREVVELDPNSSNGVIAGAEIVAPLRAVLELLSVPTDDATDPPKQALSELAAAISVSVAQLRVRRLHVELLTAFAWYFFTAGTRVYPGWNELMLLRTFEDSAWFRDEVVTAHSAGPRLRPRITTLQGQHGWVSKRIIDVTNNSWNSRLERGDRPTDRDGFFDLVARYLGQQAAATLPVAAQKPAAVCFVSSFDLELEMALWDAGEPFIIILPVFALDELWQGSASLHWVWTTVTPASIPGHDVEACPPGATEPTLRLPRGLWHPGGWKLVGPGDDLRDHLPNRGLSTPIVVRLAGSPLMERPNPKCMNPRPTSNTSALHHALLLDEYTAFQQAYQDLQVIEPALSGALPGFLSEDVKGGLTRTWILLGTQLGDPAVRLRMTAHHVSRRARTNDRKTAPSESFAQNTDSTQSLDSHGGAPTVTNDPPEVGRRTSGIVINAMSQTSDRELFLWQDFDVIDGRHTDLVASLQDLLATIGGKLTEVYPAVTREAGK